MNTEKILKQIANILSVNLQMETQAGLLQGKMGIALFFYHYARYTGNKRYDFFPEEYMSLAGKYLSFNSEKNITHGMAGLGWGIDYMIRNGFIDAEEDALDNVDPIIKKVDNRGFIDEIALNIPLFSKGLYFLQRKNAELVYESLLEVTHFIKTNPGINIPLMYINSIVYVASVSPELFRNTSFNDVLPDFLFDIAVKNINSEGVDIQDYMLLKKNISLMPEHQASKWSKLLESRNELTLTPDCYWIDFIFPDGEKAIVNTEKTYAWIQSFLNRLDYEMISIYKGLAGIGLATMTSLNDRRL